MLVFLCPGAFLCSVFGRFQELLYLWWDVDSTKQRNTLTLRKHNQRSQQIPLSYHLCRGDDTLGGHGLKCFQRQLAHFCCETTHSWQPNVSEWTLLLLSLQLLHNDTDSQLLLHMLADQTTSKTVECVFASSTANGLMKCSNISITRLTFSSPGTIANLRVALCDGTLFSSISTYSRAVSVRTLL